MLDEVMAEADRTEALALVALERDDARYVMASPLSNGRMVTAIAPPVSDPRTRSPLGSLMQGGVAGQAEPLALIPLLWHRKRRRR